MNDKGNKGAVRDKAENGARQSSSNARLAISWLVVSVPLLWGIYQTFEKSLALFR
ncbi:MAG: hypothetical protein QOJ76_2063 [Acidobacteriota bacterium]|nr:hypothetical protein [Acidobacteriota bacterium]